MAFQPPSTYISVPVIYEEASEIRNIVGAIKSSGGSDLKNTPYIYVEAKRTEKFKIHESMRQVEENIEISKSEDMPVVITRRNREITGNSLCVLRLDNFLQLYELLIKSRE